MYEKILGILCTFGDFETKKVPQGSVLFTDFGKSSHGVCLRLHLVTDMEITLRKDHSQMSPPSSSAGSPFILKFSAATVGLSFHHDSAKGTSVPDRMVKKSFLWVKETAQESAQHLGQQSKGRSRCFSQSCSTGTVPLLFSQSALCLIAHVKKTEWNEKERREENWRKRRKWSLGVFQNNQHSQRRWVWAGLRSGVSLLGSLWEDVVTSMAVCGDAEERQPEALCFHPPPQDSSLNSIKQHSKVSPKVSKFSLCMRSQPVSAESYTQECLKLIKAPQDVEGSTPSWGNGIGHRWFLQGSR